MTETNKPVLTRQSQFANMVKWQSHLEGHLNDGDILNVNIDANQDGNKEHEDCHFRGMKDGKFVVQAKWDEHYHKNAKSPFLQGGDG